MRTAKTIRRLPPETRKLAKSLNDIERGISRVNKLIPKLAEMESENIAWQVRQRHYRGRSEVDPLALGEIDGQVLAKATGDLFR